MVSRRRLVYYLLINVFVSVLVAGSVIYYYDRNHHVECNPALPNVATLPAGADDFNVSIPAVIGAGAITDEEVVIQNNGATELVLTGWYLTDNKGTAYTFPQLTLHPGVKVLVHSKAGQDSPTDLYWGRSAPVWTSGELAALYDAQNIVRAFYRVP